MVLITELDSGQEVLLYADGEVSAPGLREAIWHAARQALEEDRTGLLETEFGPVFFHVFNPPVTLIIIGAVHIAQCLVPMAQLAGYQVVIVDPRRRFATSARFAEVKMLTAWPQAALETLVLDHRTALVTLTHDPKLDDAALHYALNSRAFYIGSLGSRRTHAARLKRLARAGFEQGAVARIHAPVGLPLGGRSPAEIAIAIMAEITEVRYRHWRAPERPNDTPS